MGNIVVDSEVTFLKPAEVATRLRISLSQVHRLLRSNQLPCLRMGPQTVRVRSIDLDKFISRQLGEQAKETDD